MSSSSSQHYISKQVSSQPPNVVVVAVPLPAQGHLNQLLHLSRLISAYSIPVHYVGTASGNHQAKLRFHGCDPSTISKIHFHDFPIPPFQNTRPKKPDSFEPSPRLDSSRSNYFPSHLQPSLLQAASHLRRPVTSLVHNLIEAKQYKRVIIIHDSLMGSVVQDIASLSNVEAYTFHSVSAFTIFFFLWEKLERPFSVDMKMIQDLPSLEGCFTPEFFDFISQQHDYMKFNCGRIYNTSKVVEATFLDFLSRNEISEGKKQFALGPFNPVVLTGFLFWVNDIEKWDGSTMTDKIYFIFCINPGNAPEGNTKESKCLKWLDKQPQNSVILVSFGTTITLSDRQIVELAKGLEESEERFLWVLREADEGDIFDNQSERQAQLPFSNDEFEERVKERGMVVKDEWVPQLDILAHPATGGFMSHCGWNSCMESISFGVPMATWPMHSDQPRNAFLVVKILGVGIVVREWERRHDIVVASEIEGAVKALMASDEGGRIRRRAADLRAEVRKSVVDEGGGFRMEFDTFVEHITR